MTAALPAVALIGLLAAPSAVQPREVADEDVERAIGEAVRYLYAIQRPDGRFYRWYHQVPAGGHTAIALFALLEAGEKPSHPRVQKGLEFLVNFKTKNLYVIAVRVMVLSQLADNQTYRKPLDDDIKYLVARALRHGAWGYGGPESTGDNSCSQFALLALWEADRAGIRINPGLIRKVEQVWLRRQRADGGWPYPGDPKVKTDSTISMTTAGLASLYICQDVLANTCAPYRHQKSVDRAWEVLGKGLKPDYHDNGYLAFCVQRVGMASGRKLIAEMDWFATGAAKLCEPNPRGKAYRGKWGPVVRAAFELIFLARGRIPLTFNKLAHGDARDWNFHTRDVPHFTEYMRREFERRLRWQIVRVTDNVQRMLDGPILLITGTKSLELTDTQWGKLREYALRGGTLLFVPTHASAEFFQSAQQRLGGLFAEQRKFAGNHYQLEPLPADHPVYTAQVRLAGAARSAPMWGVSDGTRLLAVLTKRDIACPWQRRATRQKLDYSLGVNFFMYTTGTNKLRARLRPVFVGAPASEVRHRAKVAWLKHGGNWASQPYALDYLSQKLTAENRVAIQVTAGVALDGKELAGQDLAWMTGSEAFQVTEQELLGLRGYLDGGGTLFVNAIGGSQAFNAAAAKMIGKLLAGRGIEPEYPHFNSPLLTGKCADFRGPPLKKLIRSRKWRNLAKQAPHAPVKVYRLSGRAAIIHASHGIHDTLDGHTAWGALSYMPPSARDVAANVVLYGLSQRVK